MRVFARDERSYDFDQRALVEHRHDWDELAALDALWAIRSKRKHKFGRWGVDEFFNDGAAQAARLVDRARRLGYPREWGSVLDFGCGVGRLAPALSSYFDKYCGVDLSIEMIARARALHRPRLNCDFIVGQEAGVDGFERESFDLVFSLYVLQHMTHRSLILSHIQKLAGLVRPGGLLVLQLPDRIPSAEKLFYDTRRNLFRFLDRMGVSRTLMFRWLGLFPMTMNSLPEATVLAVLGAQQVKLLGIDSERRGIAMDDRTYYATPKP